MDGGRGYDLGSLAAAMLQASANTAFQVGQLAETLQQAEARRTAAQGYRTLKPKRDITTVTAESAKVLLLEQVQFAVDLGELGIPTASEAAYRQLRAAASGRAKDTIDLALSHGNGLAYATHLEQQKAAGAPQAQVDHLGSLLYQGLMQELERVVHLTSERRTQIAVGMYNEARMTHDTAKAAEEFLTRYRRGRYLMHLTGLLPDRNAMIQNLAAQGVDAATVQAVDGALANADRRDLNDVLESRLSASPYAFIKLQPVQPTTVEAILELVQRWIESQNKRPDPSPVINAMGQIPADSGWSESEWRLWLGSPAGGFPAQGGSGGLGGLLDEERRMISRIGQETNAAQMAAMGKGKGKGKSSGKFQGSKAYGGSPGKGTGGVKASPSNLCTERGCLTRHSDVITCPGRRAARDIKYRSGEGKCDHLIYGKFKCDSANHWRRHHREQLEEEALKGQSPSRTFPTKGGKKGKGRGKGKIRTGASLDGEHSWDEEVWDQPWDDFAGYDGEWDAAAWADSSLGWDEYSTYSSQEAHEEPWAAEEDGAVGLSAVRSLYEAFAQKSNETLDGVLAALREQKGASSSTLDTSTHNPCGAEASKSNLPTQTGAASSQVAAGKSLGQGSGMSSLERAEAWSAGKTNEMIEQMAGRSLPGTAGRIGLDVAWGRSGAQL